MLLIILNHGRNVLGAFFPLAIGCSYFDSIVTCSVFSYCRSLSSIIKHQHKQLTHSLYSILVNKPSRDNIPVVQLYIFILIGFFQQFYISLHMVVNASYFHIFRCVQRPSMFSSNIIFCRMRNLHCFLIFSYKTIKTNIFVLNLLKRAKYVKDSSSLQLGVQMK